MVLEVKRQTLSYFVDDTARVQKGTVELTPGTKCVRVCVCVCP